MIFIILMPMIWISLENIPFQNLNTATFIRKNLAEQLLTLSPNQEIIDNQTSKGFLEN
jgi:hypothetical protein